MTTPATNTHIYFLLDRSGSMAAMVSDVIGGFNSFLDEQSREGEDALMTLIQFDSQDSHEVLADSSPLSSVPKLNDSLFVPRGGTPLFDAIGHGIADATIRTEMRKSSRLASEEIVFVTFSDGEENQSVEYSKQQIFDLIERKQKDGWNFVFLGANQDAYATGGAVGFTPGNSQNFAADGAGSQEAFASLSRSTSVRRQKMRRGEQFDRADYFEGDKSAEADLAQRGGPSKR
jgi:uncharacterized protein YegL